MATGVRGARTDEEIQRDVLNELKFEPRVQPNEIGVVGAGGDRRGEPDPDHALSR